MNKELRLQIRSPLFFLVMIPNEKELKLIKIYMYICDLYDSELIFAAVSPVCSAFCNKVFQFSPNFIEGLKFLR